MPRLPSKLSQRLPARSPARFSAHARAGSRLALGLAIILALSILATSAALIHARAHAHAVRLEAAKTWSAQPGQTADSTAAATAMTTMAAIEAADERGERLLMALAAQLLGSGALAALAPLMARRQAMWRKSGGTNTGTSAAMNAGASANQATGAAKGAGMGATAEMATATPTASPLAATPRSTAPQPASHDANDNDNAGQQGPHIAGMIGYIAVHANILALDAAVEAARGGKDGHDLAQISSDACALGRRAASAAGEIKEWSENAAAQIDAGASLLRQAGAAMDEMVAGVQRLAATLTGGRHQGGDHVGHPAGDQAGAQAELHASATMAQMALITQNATLVRQASQAAAGMREHAARLARLAASLKPAAADVEPAMTEAISEANAASTETATAAARHRPSLSLAGTSAADR